VLAGRCVEGAWAPPFRPFAWHRAGPGTTVYIPAGTVHAFRNATGQPARHLLIGLPEVVAMLVDMGARPREAWETVSQGYRTHFSHDQ
jgi:Cupin domain